ncbi:hypothetical protein WKW77_25020 [Variovorax ureilyticus]|uniref:Cytochrome c domain-containing protein n=1 Tax=Variovorax ureilyticus TaxID=1836198 RepID=A0ABU8VL42_9BURK
MATLLEDSVIEGLARYYAAQKPGPGIAGDPRLIARGKTLYEKGDSSRNVVACSTCHGQRPRAMRSSRAWPASMQPTWRVISK